MIECPKCLAPIHAPTEYKKQLDALRAELDRQKELNARLHQGVCDGYAAMLGRLRRLEEAIKFALSTESGFACPASTEERLRSALGAASGNAPLGAL